MKQFISIALVSGVAIGLAVTTWGASTNVSTTGDTVVSKRIQKYCEPVCEIQAQDSAFSLLIEAYRQFQSREIELNYQARLKAAANLGQEPDSLVIGTKLDSARTMRAWVEALAEKERDLRMEQLQTRLANFNTAYHCTRKADETAIAQPVANKEDRQAAAQQLKTLRLLSLGSPTSADFQTVQSQPAAGIFLNSPPANLWPQEIVGPCDETPNPPQ